MKGYQPNCKKKAELSNKQGGSLLELGMVQDKPCECKDGECKKDKKNS